MNSSVPTPVTQASFSITSGESRAFGPGPLTSPLGHTYFYFWSCQEGSLAGLNGENSHVRYTAPLVAAPTTDHLYVWVGSSGGKSTEGVIEVTVLPAGSTLPPIQGQLTASYNSANANFALGYQLPASATRAWILASLDGANWNQVYAVDPVTSGNRSGSPTVTVPGSGAATLAYFKLRVQEGASAPQEGAAVAVAYTPIPALPKSTELPNAPNLVINGLEVSVPQAQLFWGRVNDRLNQDNVVKYEVERATNADFSGAVLLDAGNTAPGMNMYESVFYTAMGLSDNTTYYFRVRGVNNVGTGPWSNVDSIRVNVQDRPVIDASPVFPAHGATGVTKLPALECQVSDPEGDAFYCAFEIAESPSGPWRYFGHGGQPDYRNVTRLDPTEWNPPLKPNTHYYWRAIVHEEGRNLDYYGGTWPPSAVWEFTTENVGGAYAITQIQHVVGALKPFELITYRVTVTNSGNGPAAANFVEALYVKNGQANPFLYNAPGQLPALNPGESASADVTVYFRDALFTASNGVTYDNVLVTGASTLRFRTSPDEGTVGTASQDYPINYVNQGGPTFNLLVRGPSSNNPNAPLGGYFEIIASITDDIRTTRALIEYRTNPSAPWQFLDDFTGNTNPWFSFQTTSHSGSTVPSSQNATRWNFPTNWTPTSTLQVRLTAFDDVGAYNTAVSNPMTIFDNTLTVNAGPVQFPSYRLGDQVLVPLSVMTPMRVTNLSVQYVYGSYSVGIYNQVNGAGISVPPLLAVTLPTQEAYVNSAAKLRVEVTATISGVTQRTVTDESNGTFEVRMPDLPAPFNSAITLFSENYPFPLGSLYRQEVTESVALDWEGDTTVHAVVRRYHGYNLSETYTGTPEYSGDECFHVRYNRSTKVLDQLLLPGGYLCEDVKVLTGTPYFLLRNGNNVYWSSRSGNSFSTPQLVATIDAATGQENPEFMRRGSELYLTWQGNTHLSGANWRHRLKRILPSGGSQVEHAFRIDGTHLDYGTHLNTPQGLYILNGNLSAGTAVVTWPYAGNGARFVSLDPNIAGIRFGYQDYHFMDLVSPTGLFTRWDALIADPVVKAFNDVALTIGKGTTQGLAGEDNHLVAIRRNQTSGQQERVVFGDPGLDNFSSIQRRIAITDSRWMAAAWRKQLAVGYFGADLTAPIVGITTADSSFASGQPKTLEWTVTDNLNQLSSLKVIQLVGGIPTELASSSGAIPTSISHVFNTSAPSLIFRIEAYDQAGNRGVAEKVLSQSSDFTLDSFSASTFSILIGVPLNLQWSSTPEDAFRIYTILTRPAGTEAWKVAGSVTGNVFSLNTNMLTGSHEVRLQSGEVFRDLSLPITTTGSRFSFDEAGFTPGAGMAYYLTTSPVLRLTWPTNQEVSPTTIYTILGRWNGSGNFAVLGATTDKQMEVSIPAGSSQIEWKVSALWEGLEFVSGTKNVPIALLASVTAPTVTAGGRDTVNPWVDSTWPAIPGAESYAVFRRHVRTGFVEEIARTESPDYQDASISFGESYAYSVAPLLSGVLGAAGPETTITVSALLPLGIAFVNNQYEVLPANTNLVQWNAVLLAGVVSVFQDYEVILRQGDGTIANVYSVQPASGLPAQVALAALPYNRSFVMEVFARSPSGTRLSVEPARLHFSTGFDTRTIAGAAAVGVPEVDAYGFNLSWEGVVNADYYDIFRRTTSTGPLEWIGRSSTTGFSDTGIQPGEGASYVVRSRNGLMHTDAVETTPRPFGEQQNLRPTGVMRLLGGQDFEFGFTSQYGATYRVEYSPDLMNWLNLGSSISGSGEDMNVLVPGIGTSGRYFFRVVKP
ncbi:MAG: fibronectin type III domain-containing protein [Prosthecobacter sp.]|uniref:hypothetical protein n=1 Tax=Prosthecobacter sp. TaxID=1965333 RepID=UPI0019E5E35E|nr:hypothetical protein [Prosthecobacter sp.]MBE2282347.1 fibronectin type III domain-containing protein [Prosthecobacter sp.]